MSDQPTTYNLQPTTSLKEPEIVVIPEKFYGTALKMNAPPPAQQALPPPPPKPVPPPKPIPPPSAIAPLPRHSVWPMVLIVLALVLIVGGAFTYLNRNVLFKKKPPIVVTPPPPIVAAPTAPANLTAAASSGAIALSWVDTATNETGYRLERREDQGTFLPLTNLSSNSTAFLDVSVQPGKTYSYRVVALNNAGESSASNEASVQVAAVTPPPPAAPSLPPGGLDSDSDGVSDVEEPLYGTDPHNPDTDNDGFLDGNEVFHLYNPAAKAPVRLLDSGLVSNLTAPAGWSFYIPAKWKGTLIVADGSQATVATDHPETFDVKIEDNPQHLPLMDWYLGKNPGVVSSAVRAITTKGRLEGILGVERMDAYFAWDGKILVLRYQLNGQPFVNYRTTFEMMLNSLKLVGAPALAPAPVSNESVGGPGTLVGAPPTSTGTLAPASGAEASTGTKP